MTNTLYTQYFNDATCIPALVEIVAGSPHWQIRQLAVVELRKLVVKFWGANVGAEVKDALRARLLEIVIAEQKYFIVIFTIFSALWSDIALLE